jgi:Integrase core domain
MSNIRMRQSACLLWICRESFSGYLPNALGLTLRRAAPYPISKREFQSAMVRVRFTSLAQAPVALGCWRADYNGSRPHTQLGWKTPSEFAFTFHPRRDLALRDAKGSAPAPVAPTAQQGKSNGLGELKTRLNFGATSTLVYSSQSRNN